MEPSPSRLDRGLLSHRTLENFHPPHFDFLFAFGGVIRTPCPSSRNSIIADTRAAFERLVKGLTEGAREQQLNRKLIALAAKIDEIETILHSGGLGDDGEDDAAVDKLTELEGKLAKVAATTLEDMKLKARYVDLNCVMAHNIGPVPASIIRDLLAPGGKPKASAPKEGIGGQDARHS